MSEPRPYPITEAVLEQRRNAALKHGGQAEHQIRPVARAQKRRLMRQLGMRISDLDGVANALLDNWARAHAKVTIMDEYFAARGFIRPDGEPEPVTKIYFIALNSARLALTRFGEYQKARTPERDVLSDYVIETYGNGDDEG